MSQNYQSFVSLSRTLGCFFVLFFFSISLSAQTENCTNGIDDDGDGLIDCYDQDCTCTGPCEDFYYTTCNADCYYAPPCDQISLGIQWTSTAQTGTYSTLMAGDMDKDGIPDIVTYRVEGTEIFIIDGKTGAIKVQINGPTVYPGGTAPAIADLDKDGFGELILVGQDRYLRCWNHDGTLNFTSAIQVGYDQRYQYSVPNIADFDHDGQAEINIGNQVFNGQNGALLAQGGVLVSAGEHPARKLNGFSFNSTVAIDALPDAFCPDCAGLEIVAGNQVLSVNLVTGVVTAVVTAPAAFSDGFTSIADFDRDGDLDAIVQGRKNGQNTIYCWEMETSTIMREYKLINNYFDGASRANVADLDGDGQLEISFVGHPRLYALDNNFSLMWQRTANDPSSITCSSVFDFCGDGSADVVYRGSSALQVLEGATGIVKWQDNCFSETHIENPLILDVDADGQTEIVVQCGTFTGQAPYPGTVVAYEAVGTPGIASRKVWNQHAYFNTNINDDLSVPRYQQNPHLVGDGLKLNGFLNQYFNPTFPSPDGVFTIQNVFCDKDSLELSLTVCNIGDNLLPANTPISAYQSNPQTTNAAWVGAIPLGYVVKPDSCYEFKIRVPRIANDSVFLVLNDNHSTALPYSLSNDFPITSIGECRFTNNMVSFIYRYQPDMVNLGKDTAICDNGILALTAAGMDLVGWEWQNTTALSTFTAPGPGNYSVTVTDICGNTQTDAIVVTIDSATVVSLGADKFICEGEVTTLNESGFEYYNWTPANVLNCNNCPLVTATPAASGFVVLQAGFANGCVNRDSVYITVYDTFNYIVDTIVCYGRDVTWNGVNIGTDEQYTFALNTIHGCDSTVLVRVIGTTIGTYNITVDTAVCLGSTLPYLGFNLNPGDQKIYNLSAFTGCDSTVLVLVAPKDTFYTVDTLILCNGDTSTIFGNIQGQTGVFQKLFAAKNGCDSTHTVYLTVLDPIVLSLDATPACVNEPTGIISVSATGNAPPFNFQWDILGANTATVEDLPAGDYTVTVTDANDCTETAMGAVTSYPSIIFEALPDSVRCYGESNGAISIESPDETLTYSLDGGQYTQRLEYKNLGIGDYTIYVQDSYGCIDTAMLSVGQPPEFIVSLPPDATINLGDSFNLQVLTSGYGPFRYIWNDSIYLSCASCPEPIATPFVSFRYSLTIFDKNGCKAEDGIDITVQRIIGAFVPNVFSPNATNDINTTLSLDFGPSVSKIRLFQVYDRWGNMVHQVKDALSRDHSQYWDGRFQGRQVAPGVYPWIMELELVDGTTERYRGDVTILR